MGRLYPNYRPRGIRKAWDHCSVSPNSAGAIIRRHSPFENKEDPTDAAGWFEDSSGRLRVLVAEYADGRRVTLRVNGQGWNLTITPAGRAALAEGDGDK